MLFPTAPPLPGRRPHTERSPAPLRLIRLLRTRLLQLPGFWAAAPRVGRPRLLAFQAEGCMLQASAWPLSPGSPAWPLVLLLSEPVTLHSSGVRSPRTHRAHTPTQTRVQASPIFQLRSDLRSMWKSCTNNVLVHFRRTVLSSPPQPPGRRCPP